VAELVSDEVLEKLMSEHAYVYKATTGRMCMQVTGVIVPAAETIQSLAAELLAFRQVARELMEAVDTWRPIIESGDTTQAMAVAQQRASSLNALRALVKGE
jgi:hypothetical protein